MPTAGAPQRSRQRRRPRWLWLAGLCVVLGLVTSVGVAWGFAWRYPALQPHGNKDFACGFTDGSPSAWSAATWYVRGYTTTRFGTVSSSTLQDWSSFMVRHGEDPESKFRQMSGDAASQRAIARHAPLVIKTDRFFIDFAVHLYGWPLECVGCEDAFSRQDALRLKAYGDGRWPNRPPIVIDPVFDLRTHYSALAVDNALLPLFPLWPGLLADTAIYGGAWGVLILTPLGIRRWLRARRGGCPQCGYSREGLKAEAVCPECGHGA